MSIQTELPLQPTSIMVLNAEVGARQNPLIEDFLAKKRTAYFGDMILSHEIPMHELDVDLVRTQAFMCKLIAILLIFAVLTLLGT